ncbi:MAG: hypothetical protein ACRD3G_12040 [Vicinamibacterales bacterium]
MAPRQKKIPSPQEQRETEILEAAVNTLRAFHEIQGRMLNEMRSGLIFNERFETIAHCAKQMRGVVQATLRELDVLKKKTPAPDEAPESTS